MRLCPLLCTYIAQGQLNCSCNLIMPDPLEHCKGSRMPATGCAWEPCDYVSVKFFGKAAHKESS